MLTNNINEVKYSECKKIHSLLSESIKMQQISDVEASTYNSRLSLAAFYQKFKKLNKTFHAILLNIKNLVS